MWLLTLFFFFYSTLYLLHQIYVDYQTIGLISHELGAINALTLDFNQAICLRAGTALAVLTDSVQAIRLV